MPTTHRKRMVELGLAPPHHSETKKAEPAPKSAAKKPAAKKK